MIANIWGMIRQTQVQTLLSAICLKCSLLTVSITHLRLSHAASASSLSGTVASILAAGDAGKQGQPRLCACSPGVLAPAALSG